MENLILRMQDEALSLLLLLVGCCIVFFLELHLYRRSHEALHAARKRSARRKHEKDARNARSFLIGVPVIALVVLLIYGFDLSRYHLDRTENAPLRTQGTVIYTGRQNSRRRQKSHRMILVTDEGDELTLNIHKSLIDDYAIEEGAAYEVAYYPRTLTLCTADRIE